MPAFFSMVSDAAFMRLPMLFIVACALFFMAATCLFGLLVFADEEPPARFVVFLRAMLVRAVAALLRRDDFLVLFAAAERTADFFAVFLAIKPLLINRVDHDARTVRRNCTTLAALFSLKVEEMTGEQGDRMDELPHE